MAFTSTQKAVFVIVTASLSCELLLATHLILPLPPPSLTLLTRLMALACTSWSATDFSLMISMIRDQAGMPEGGGGRGERGEGGGEGIEKTRDGER